MSRIGKKPIAVPAGVEVKIEGSNVTVKGPKGTLSREFHSDIAIKLEENHVIVERPSDHRAHRSLHGTTASLIANMVEGVTNGYAKTLELVGVGYRAKQKGSGLELSLGYSHPVNIDAVEGITFEVPSTTQIIVRGIDKEIVGQEAAKIRAHREPEPYKGKGIRYSDERVRRKEGKTGK
ncbi:50S ribosomal protein L6 [Hazenella sp. IB182357]|uniref:Large ribosomal subunit protein uL6 n=1 Tax=Polycladospora coralii TaxID=2771432 RepID=A0A926NFB2_9BACL|nr:50S ribosomal protein L6 [Polycladospora coralii]MBD1372348.1 50S ribosomal protein L6 [Polycladospora coralii]MBS7531462.1 50S ribosomal protein L6 [Polycladospora coralii]